MNIAKRAEKGTDDYLAKSFVELGHVFTLLQTEENQVIYGRRGTGKTHLLKYLKSNLELSAEIVVEVDMRCLGSTSGIYADSNISLSERATRLLVDVLCVLHESIIEKCSNNDKSDISLLFPLLDNFIELATSVSIDGNVAVEKHTSTLIENNERTGTSFSSLPMAKVELLSSNKTGASSSNKNTATGKEKLKLHFGALTKTLKSLVELLPGKKLWILLDEWSEVPMDLQPFLADSLKKILFSIPNLVIKIATIEHRSNFRISSQGQTIGLELSADASTSINLDEFMVFDNDKEQSLHFFQELIYKHCKALEKQEELPKESSKFITNIFTQNSVFKEFVRASEGIPRDAIHIISNAALLSGNRKISIQTVRESARKWYSTNKSKDINAREDAVHLLDWIINKVIAEKHTRGFLIRADIKEDLIEFLYDARIIHLIKQGVSAKSHKGKRFNLYSLDYGCYADLLSTKDEPKGLLYEEGEYIKIPLIDYRTINNSILDINQYNQTGHLPLINSTDDIYLQTKHNGVKVRPDNEINPLFFSNLPNNFDQLKIKDTVYIPIIFSGLVIRKELGYERSTGSEITQAYNQYIALARAHKKPNNISRALRENEIVKSEKWLMTHKSGASNVFSLSEDWQDHWNQYFCANDLIESFF